MTFNLQNNVFGDIGNTLTSATTLLIVSGGKETLLGGDFSGDVTKEFKLTLARVTDGKIIQREIVNVTAVSGANLTIVRAVEAVPINDSATTVVQTAYTWTTTDQFYMNFTAEMANTLRANVDTIQASLTNSIPTYNYIVADATARLALTGMTAGQTIFQADTGEIYKATGATTSIGDLDNFGPYDYVVADNAARLALTGMTAGDTIFVIDSASLYIANDATTSTEKPATISTNGSGNTSGLVSEAVVIGDSLCKDTGDGLIYKTDASSATRANFYGFASETAASGSTIDIIVDGISPNHTGLTLGTKQLLTHTFTDTTGANTYSVTNNFNKDGFASYGQTLTFTNFVSITQIDWGIKSVLSTDTVTCKIYDAVNGTLLATSNESISVTNGGLVTPAPITFTFANAPFFKTGFITVHSDTTNDNIRAVTNSSGVYAGGGLYASQSVNGAGFAVQPGDAALDIAANITGIERVINADTGIIGEKNYGSQLDVTAGQAFSTTEISLGGAGSLNTRSYGVTYTEEYDGMIVSSFIRLNNVSGSEAIGEINGSIVTSGYSSGGLSKGGLSYIVPAGSNWKVSLDSVTSSTLYFIPLR